MKKRKINIITKDIFYPPPDQPKMNNAFLAAIKPSTPFPLAKIPQSQQGTRNIHTIHLTMLAFLCMLLCLVFRHLLRRGAMTDSVAQSTLVTNVVARTASRVLSVSAGFAITLTRRSTFARKNKTKRQDRFRLDSSH